MSPRESERSRRARRYLAGGFGRFRLAYFRIPPNLRFGLLCVLVVGSGILAAVIGWPLVRTAGLVALGLFAFVFAMAHPRGAASGAVLVAWLFSIPLMGVLAYERVARSGPAVGDAAALALLGILVVGVAHLIKSDPPWQTALLALVPAGVLGSLIVLIVPPARVLPAYAVAAGVLVYRAVARKRLRGGGTAPTGDHGEYAGDASREQAYEEISVEEALAELENMIGMEPVKRQVRGMAASIEAARMRAQAGYPTEKPMRHFVFVGPPGTGKTTVARVLARIFYAFGLLERPSVVEAHRADLVGEHLGATALKTNQLVDAALGGVLFIDEAYGLANRAGDVAGGGPGDKFGAEAVQTLLKRAEDDRDQVVVILAGYEREMDDFLAQNPGLNSRFSTRVRFPSYAPAELLQIAEYHVAERGERLHPDAVPGLWPLFEDVCRRGLVDELGNARFVRSLIESSASARDVRVVEGFREPAPQELVTILRGDIEAGYADVTARFRGYADTPTLGEALAELDNLVGLEPVKRQVHGIAAQLRVARVRREQGVHVSATAPPMRHFVFTGPPGTGKTTVARILGRVFAALGLLARPEVVEAARVDLVGEHLGETSVKTNRLVDSALGGVLFVDEAYSLYNEGYSGGDAFGSEAIATLLKRAEDDRDKLVVVLAGYPADMNRFLGRNQGLASRFSTRVSFPSYGPGELRQLATVLAEGSGDSWDEEAGEDLEALFEQVSAEGLVDELGNGRFVRSLYEEAAAARDVRLADYGHDVTPWELTTVTRADVRAAYEELSAPYRGDPY